MRKYTDISHFRAPFKNWPGIGADMALPDPVAVQIKTDENGVRVFDPVLADLILRGLTNFSVIFLDNDAVKLETRFTGDPREDAAAWARRKLDEGKSVVAQAASGAHLFVTPIAMDRFLRAASSTEQEKEYTAGVTPIGAVLARPTSRAGLFGLGPFGVAAVAVGVVGVGMYLFGKKRRRAVPNRIHSSRRARARRYWDDWAQNVSAERLRSVLRIGSRTSESDVRKSAARAELKRRGLKP